MKNNPVPGLILSFVLALLLLFPCTPYGRQLIQTLFPSVNFEEEALLSSRPHDSPEPVSSPTSVMPAVQEDYDRLYTTALQEELPGTYVLVSLFTPGEEISGDTLAAVSRLGIPLTLTIEPDGSAELLIFDRKTLLSLDSGSMLLTSDGIRLPFFYHAGRITVQEDRSYLVFEKP